MSYVDDGEVFLPIRNKINAIVAGLAIAVTDEAISAGAVTSIPIATTTQNLLDGGDVIQLVDIDTGAVYELTLSLSLASGATAISINSYTFPSDVPSGSYVLPSIKSLCTKTYTP